MRKTTFFPTMFLVLCLALFVCACAPSEPSSETPGQTEPPGTDPPLIETSCELELTLPDVLRYGAPAEPLSGVCACGRPVSFASLSREFLEIEGGLARATDTREGDARLLPWGGESDNILAYHAPAEGENGAKLLYTGRIPLERGRYAEISHPALALSYGEQPELSEHFRFPEEPSALLPGAHVLSCLYNADPIHYEDFALTVQVTVTKKPAVPATHPACSAVYAPGLTLADLPLAPGFFWQKPETELRAGTGEFSALYLPDEYTEPYALKISVEISRAAYPGEISLPDLSAVTYDEEQTLADVPIPAGFRWKTPSEVPAVKKNAYAAIFDPGADYLPVETEIPLTVLPKEGDPAVFPTLPQEMPFADEKISALLRGDTEGFWIENDTILHAQAEPHPVTICFRKNENYVMQTKTVFVTVVQAVRYDKPSRPEWAGDESGRIHLFPKIGEPELEYSTDGAEWTTNPVFPAGTGKVYYRFRETQDFLAGETQELPIG